MSVQRSRERAVFAVNSAGTIGFPYGKKNELDQYFTPLIKLSSRQILNLNVKAQTVELLEILLKTICCQRTCCDCELWPAWPPYSIVYLQLQVGLTNKRQAEAEKSVSSSLSLLPPQLLTRNLLFSRWSEGSSFLALQLGGPQQGSEKPNLSKYQRLLCVNPPCLKSLKPCQVHQNIGTTYKNKGLMILELRLR